MAITASKNMKFYVIDCEVCGKKIASGNVTWRWVPTAFLRAVIGGTILTKRHSKQFMYFHEATLHPQCWKLADQTAKRLGIKCDHRGH